MADAVAGRVGVGLCEEIRRRDKTTPIVIFSAHAHEADRRAGMLAGANVYLVKPDISQVVPTVKPPTATGPRRRLLTLRFFILKRRRFVRLARSSD